MGHYIKERTKNAQFVIISLRNNMFELADRLVGIYKVGMQARKRLRSVPTRSPFARSLLLPPLLD